MPLAKAPAPQFGGWFSFLKRTPKAAPQPAAPPKPAVLSQEETKLVEALAHNDAQYIEHLFQTYPQQVNNNFVLYAQPGQPYRVAAMKGEGGKNMLWVDIQGDSSSLLFQHLAKARTLTDFQKETPENNDIPFDVPVIDHDSVQMTVYCIRLNKEKNEVEKEEMYLYVGDNFLISLHPNNRPSISNTMDMLMATGKFKDPTPAGLMNYIIKENINRYSNVMSTLHQDMSLITQKASGKNVDRSIIHDGLRVGQKIDDLHYNVNQQLGVLNKLADLNQFHDSPLVSKITISSHVMHLERLLTKLDHHQDVKEALDANVQASFSNVLNNIMKKVCSIGMLTTPYTIPGALWGMNVPVPFANDPFGAYYIAGGATAVAGAMFLALKRAKWL